ncbi:MAG TPA: hypothetical protein VMV95_03400 [Bacillota bacterium]|nr:hypothetical protein [Bacillota bacterium]
MGDVVLRIIILAFGLLAFIESIAIMIFPKQMIEIGKKWMRHVKHMRKIALIEFIVALAFILIGIFVL